MTTGRKYDIVVFGATGYTGKLVCETLVRNSPSNLRWAVAGRSLQKLELLANDLNRQYPDRSHVETFVCDLSEFQIEKLASITSLLISTVGPYHRYGTPVLEACAVYGTHYVDCTGEYPWVYDMIKRCHKTAKNKGAIIVPQCGYESAPADLCTYLLVKTLQDNVGVGADSVTLRMDAKGAISGGTLETVLNLFDVMTLQELSEASKHDALSPVKGPEQPFTAPVTNNPDLGLLTTSIGLSTDRAQVFRSWGLYNGGEFYGKNFTWKEYARATSWFGAVAWNVAITVLSVLFITAPFRWVVRKLVKVKPGEGPGPEAMRRYYARVDGIAVADTDDETPPRACVSLKGPDMYTQTAIYVAQLSLAILYDKDTLAHKLGGGIMTPATLANPELFRRLDRSGITMEAKMM